MRAMARKLRVQYPGATYHVMNGGDRREAIFADDQDRHRFLKTLGEACEKTRWQVHAYCLMSNHFHLVLETPQPSLVAGKPAWHSLSGPCAVAGAFYGVRLPMINLLHQQYFRLAYVGP